MSLSRFAWFIAGCILVYTAGELAFAWFIVMGWHP